MKLRRPSRSAPGLSRKKLDGMGCGCRRDEGRGKKTEVARGGWAEDARRPPATSFVSVVIPLLIKCLDLSEISDRKSQRIDWDELIWNFALKDKNERRWKECFRRAGLGGEWEHSKLMRGVAGSS